MEVRHPLFIIKYSYLLHNEFEVEEIDDTLKPFYEHFIECIKNSKEYKNGKREFDEKDLFTFIEFYNKTDVPEKINIGPTKNHSVFYLVKEINESLIRVNPNIDFKFI